jgi:hypothetical protein
MCIQPDDDLKSRNRKLVEPETARRFEMKYKILAEDFDEATGRRRIIRIVELVEVEDDRELLRQLRWNASQLSEVYAIVKMRE